jgi:GAF domain-containing protein
VAPAGPLPRVGVHRSLLDVLALARARTGADAALVSEVHDGVETVREVDQDGAFPAVVPGLSAPLRDTICERLLTGRIGHVVDDVRADPDLGALPLVRELRIGAYLGVPLTAADARTYLLCCIAREARRDLGDDEVRFVRGLAARVRATLDAAGPVPFV